MTNTLNPCSDCSGWAYSGDQANYHHIHETKQLPATKWTDDHTVRHGYAVGISGPAIDQLWAFFEHLEPALVFGRAARMSFADISGYGVYEAAHELRFVKKLRPGRRPGDERTLHVDTSRSLDRVPGEVEAFGRWVAGCDPTSSYFEPKGRP